MENDDNKDLDLEINEETETEETQEQDKDWKAEAMKYKSIARRYKAKAEKPEKPAEKQETEITNEKTEEPRIDDKLWEVAEYIQQGYTRADAEFIQKNGGKEALKDPNSYVSVALRTMSEQRKAEQLANQTQDTSQMSEVERKYTPEQLKNMSAKELEEILPRA